MPPLTVVKWGHFTGFERDWNYPQPRGTRPIDERSQGKVYTTVLERCFEVLQVLQFIGRILYVDRGHQPRKPLSTSRSTEVCYARHQTDADQGGRR
jgi:hypothetical protein